MLTKESTKQIHTEPLPVCCPITKNPITGSTIQIKYTPVLKELELVELREHLSNYRTRDCVARDMEAVVVAIAQFIANMVQVQVEITADLLLNTSSHEIERVIIACIAHPKRSS
jgi:NADPH-dependent 7-cyano-7-deazaguanine reductase QueF